MMRPTIGAVLRRAISHVRKWHKPEYDCSTHTSAHERITDTRGPSVHSTRSLESAIMLLRRADSDQHLPDHLTPLSPNECKDIRMARKSSREPQPFEIAMNDLAGERELWNLQKHLDGCLVGYQHDSTYAAAVYFALEALWGITHDVGVRAKSGKLDQNQLDADWIVSPQTTLPVPWIWIRSLATAWERYKTDGGPLGSAFGLEGGGQGKSPTITKLTKMLNERAIARWIGSRVQEARAAGKEMKIEDVIQDAAERFDKSDVTIRRAWQRFGQRERLRAQDRS